MTTRAGASSAWRARAWSADGGGDGGDPGPGQDGQEAGPGGDVVVDHQDGLGGRRCRRGRHGAPVGAHVARVDRWRGPTAASSCIPAPRLATVATSR